MSQLGDKIFLTFDMDWVCDEAIVYTTDLLAEYDVSATFFVTHYTPTLEVIGKHGHELGIHPNFNSLLNNESAKDAIEIIADLSAIVPDARSVRSHSLTRSAYLSNVYCDLGFTHESNLFVPFTGSNVYLPFENPHGLVQIAHTWGDYSYCSGAGKCDADEYLEKCSVRILNFHPIHVFLNSYVLSEYEQAKRFTKNYALLKGHMRSHKFGVRRYLESILKSAKVQGLEFSRLSEIFVGAKA